MKIPKISTLAGLALLVTVSAAGCARYEPPPTDNNIVLEDYPLEHLYQLINGQKVEGVSCYREDPYKYCKAYKEIINNFQIKEEYYAVTVEKSDGKEFILATNYGNLENKVAVYNSAIGEIFHNDKKPRYATTRYPKDKWAEYFNEPHRQRLIEIAPVTTNLLLEAFNVVQASIIDAAKIAIDILLHPKEYSEYSKENLENY